MFSCGNSFLLTLSQFWYSVLHLAKMWQNSLFRIVLEQKNLSKVGKPERKNMSLSDLYGDVLWFVWYHDPAYWGFSCFELYWCWENIIILNMLKHYSFMQLEFCMLLKCKSYTERLVCLKKNAQFKSSMAISNSKIRLAVISVSLAAFSKSNMVPLKCHHPILFLTKPGNLDMLVLNI